VLLTLTEAISPKEPLENVEIANKPVIQEETVRISTVEEEMKTK